MKKISLFFAVMASLLFTFMTLPGKAQIIGNRMVREEVRNLSGNFQNIINNGPADIFIRQGKNVQIIVKADENIISLITTKIQDGTLSVGVKRGIRFAKTMQVIITVPHIQKLINNGSGDILFKTKFNEPKMYIGIYGSGDFTAGLEVKNLILKLNGSGDAQISGVHGKLMVDLYGSGDIKAGDLQLLDCSIKEGGSGDIQLSGKTSRLNLLCSGSGDIDASHLYAIAVKASGSGSGDIWVHPVQELEASLTGSGDLRYTGNPQLLKTRSLGSGDIIKR